MCEKLEDRRGKIREEVRGGLGASGAEESLSAWVDIGVGLAMGGWRLLGMDIMAIHF